MATSSPPKRRKSRKKAPPRQRTESREQSAEGFRAWLDYMADGLREFFECLPAEVRTKLDYSVESLDVLEAWLLERYPSSDAAIQQSETLIIDGAARYVGETFCKILGGHWWVDVKHDTFLGLPQITGFRPGPDSLCPLSYVTASTNRRRGDFISSILRIELADRLERKQG